MNAVWVVPIALALSACGPTASPTMTSAQTPAEEGNPQAAVPAPRQNDRCAALTREACLLARDCTLEHVAKEAYRCRPPADHCEQDYSQIAAYEQSPASGECEARDGCRFAPRDGCYCRCRGYGHAGVPDGDEAPRCDCECSGGDFGGCRPIKRW
jgi:hypothetical protein